MTVRLYRLLAALCDLLIATVFFLLWGWMRLSASGVGWWLLGTVLFAVAWMEVCWRLHGSPGKAMFNLGVNYRSRGTVYLRELVGKTATWFTGGLGLLSIFLPQQRALHDYIANTDVSKIPNASGLVDGLRIGFAALVGGVVVLAYVGAKDSVSTAIAAPPAKWNVNDSSKAVMTVHVYRGKDEYAQGSGFLIDGQGTAVSNVHVIGAGDRAEVELEDGRKFAVTDVRAYDMTQDVAIFKIGNAVNTSQGAAAGTFPAVQLGTSGNLQVLDKVVVISSPEGLSNTVTEGILSAKRGGEQPALQVSAAISPGSSGGPVFDEAGRVGVAQSQWDEGENLNFAIPVEVVSSLLKKPDMNVTTQKFFSNVLHRDVHSDKDYDDDNSGDDTKSTKH